ncbi:MAG: glycosyltransferase family 4 protein [Chitinophagaceae bacterium]|nr:glycosyltransferase family 4 protein [Chitinophagaceae bacterium]
MMNRIIFDCERMKYENTGLYHYCLNLGNHIVKFTRPETEELRFYSPLGVEYLFNKGIYHLTQTELHKFRMPSLNKFSVWHATYQDSYYLPFRNKKIKVVLSVHDLNFMYDTSKSEFKKQRNLRRLQMLINRADVIICISEYARNDLNFYCDVQNKPIHVIHNGTNTLTEPELLKQSYKPGRPFIFTLGTVMPKKNFHSLLPLVQDQEQLELVIAGRIDDVGYYQSILDAAEKMGISKKVKLVGPVSENEKSWYFNNCYAFALPSTAEGFGLPVTEAMSVGKPLFLSDRTALPEIGGDVAFYFENFSATHMKETFVAGMKQYKLFKMQEKIIEKGKEYNWDIAAQEYWKIYRSLV